MGHTPEQIKRCNKCGDTKSVDEFYKRYGTERYRHICKVCYSLISKANYRINSVAKNEKSRQWARDHPVRAIEIRQKFERENRDKISAYVHNYRARVRGNGGKHTAKEWRDLCHKYGNKCLCCGSCERLTKDHVVPVSRGGVNTIDNLQLLCKSCNSKKNNRKSADYRR